MTGSMLQWALGDFDHELLNTRRCLERIPDTHWDFRPHERSWTLGEIAVHLARLPVWPRLTLEQDSLDLAARPKDPEAPRSRAEVLDLFDRNVAALKEALARADDAVLRRPWTLRMGERSLMTAPTVASLRQWGISHMIHHRGQLTIYLRLAGAPVPGLYGPSADER